MMRAMYSAVTGLRTHLAKMDTIGNNLANVNTPGYKKGQVTFKDLMSQTQRGASAAKPTGLGGLNPQQIGMGVGTGSINVIHTRMGGTRTENPTDVMIEGEGFFVISPQVLGGEKYYVRAGNFNLDNVGNLVTAEGFHVLGYLADYKGELDTSQVAGLKINQSETVNPTVTEKIELRGNLDSNMKKTDPPYYADTQIRDSLGNAYNVTYELKKADDYSDTNQAWNMRVSRITEVATKNYFEPAGDEFKFQGDGIDVATISLVFNKEGKLVSIGGKPAVDRPEINLRVDTATINGTGFNKRPNGEEVPAADVTKINGNIGASKNGVDGLIKIFDPMTPKSYEQITQYANDTNMKPYALSGSTSGNLTGFSIGTDGVITGSFSNGDTKILGQLLLAKFDNPMGLEKVANNMFRESRNSGEAQFGVGNASGFGAIASGTLEMSNVDMAQEFTDIITTQRGFQANSRVITTSDEMLQELVNIKR